MPESLFRDSYGLRFWVIVAAFVMGMIMLLTTVALSALITDRWQCGKLESRSGKTTDWYLFGGCFIEVNGKMIPVDNWRGEYEQ